MKIDKKGRTRPRMTLDVNKKVQPLADFMNESFQKWKRPYDYLVFDDFIMKSGASNDPLQTTYKEKARFRLGQAYEWQLGTTESPERPDSESFEPKKQLSKPTFGHRFHCLVDKDCYLQRIEFGLPNQFNKYKGKSDILLETLADSSIRHQDQGWSDMNIRGRTKYFDHGWFGDPGWGYQNPGYGAIFQEKLHRTVRFSWAECRICFKRRTVQSTRTPWRGQNFWKLDKRILLRKNL